MKFIEKSIDENTKSKFPNYDKTGTYHTTYKCPNCDNTIHLDWHEKKNYCANCGQKLKFGNRQFK